MNIKTVLFQTIQFSSIWPIDRTLSGAPTPGQSGLGSDGNERVLRIPQSFTITGTSSSDCLVLYLGHSLVEWSYSSAEIQSVYSIAPADWANFRQYILFSWCCAACTDFPDLLSPFVSIVHHPASLPATSCVHTELL